MNMIDQASELRKLVLQSVRRKTAAAGPAPRLVVVTSGRVEVGVTTIAVNLAVALSEHGSRVVAVDADMARSEVAHLCGVPDDPGVHDVLVARRDIHEVLQRGPAGIQVVPGSSTAQTTTEWPEVAQQRLLRQLSTLGRHAEVVVVDAGGASGEFLRRCCEAADQTLVVTTPDPTAIMDTYARIKTSVAGLDALSLQLIVNRCDTLEESQDVHQRIDQSCQRFLGHQMQLLANIPDDPAVEIAAEQAMPFVVNAAESPAALQMSHLATAILQQPAPKRDRNAAA